MEVRVFSAAPLITKNPRQGIFCYVDGGEDYAVKDVTLATVAKSFPCLLTSQRLVRKKSTLVDFCSPNSRTALITQNPRQGIFCYVDGGEDYVVKDVTLATVAAASLAC